MFDFFKIESDIEDISKNSKENSKNIEQTESSIQKIEESIQRLNEDHEIQGLVEKNKEAKESEFEAFQQRKEEIHNQIQNEIHVLEEMKEANNASKGELMPLQALGIDVSEGLMIVEERNAQINEDIQKLLELDENLDVLAQNLETYASESSQETIDDTKKKFSIKDLFHITKEEAPVSHNTSIKKDLKKRGIKAKEFGGQVFAESDFHNGFWYLVNDVEKYEIFRDHITHPTEFEHVPYEEFKLVNSRDIQGVCINSGDFDYPDGFWGMHSRSQESWSHFSSSMSLVAEQIEAGKSIEEIRKSPDYNSSLDAYFNKEHNDVVEVIEYNGIYVFQEDGRHRVFTAQEFNAPIMVKVIGKYRRK